MRALVLVAACALAPPAVPATPYQPLAASGGYSNSDLGDGLTQIAFEGNEYTRLSTIECFVWRRAAEVCTHGYDVVSEDIETDTMTMGTGVTLPPQGCERVQLPMRNAEPSRKRPSVVLLVRCRS